MKIEKLNENRIQITFNNSYLKENNIDMHTFMSNSIESQSLFLNLLNEAEREVGFITDDYKLSIEALALSNGNFIITITRIEKENLKSIRVQAKRKNTTSTTQTQLLKFDNFDDFCNFENFLSICHNWSSQYFSTSNLLYKYNNSFYFILNDIESTDFSKIINIASDFGNIVENAEIVINKIKECGLLVRDNLVDSKP